MVNRLITQEALARSIDHLILVSYLVVFGNDYQQLPRSHQFALGLYLYSSNTN